MRCLLSGGADGADRMWAGSIGGHCKEKIVFTYAGHRMAESFKQSNNFKLYFISSAEQEAARSPVRVAAIRLGKQPPGPGSKQLIMRNHALATRADCLIAIGKRTPPKTQRSVLVDGGTGWTVQMFADRFEPFTENEPLHAFLFDDSKWMQLIYKPAADALYGWKDCSLETAVKAAFDSDCCGFIGSRELTTVGVAEISRFETTLKTLEDVTSKHEQKKTATDADLP